ncbi:hypothetical protein COR50_04145 [Chitinophaga caeni]|uniref:Uncharacterized protein n=1 Tax=Chitinophaga caeni TaxID=2029983 RepID=A0A291QQZ2_9BACT|nr:hypothetical protein [Chitinophaga caeni]ATL46429.1 hypothetical protein COR50_04145 [Chitinophaga caeni]
MKRLILLFTCVVLSIVKLNAQGISKDQYNDVIDYFNNKITFYYLQSYTTHTNEKKKEFDKIKEVLANVRLGNSLNRKELGDLISNDFKNTNELIVDRIDELKNKFEDSINISRLKEILDYELQNIKKIKNINYISAAIEDNYDNLWKETKNFLTEQEDTDSAESSVAAFNTTAIDTPRKKNEFSSIKKMNLPNNSFAPNYLSIILIIMGLVVIYIIISRAIRALKEKVNTLERRLVKVENQGMLVAPPSKNIKAPEIKDFQDNLEIMNERILSMELTLNYIRDNTANTEPAQEGPDPSLAPDTLLYAPIPNSQGQFDATKVNNQFNTMGSFYKFTITDHRGSEASFEFIGNKENQVREATNAPDMILRPVCNIKNSLNQNARSIKTIEPGIVRKNNGKWELYKKAEIEYE